MTRQSTYAQMMTMMMTTPMIIVIDLRIKTLRIILTFPPIIPHTEWCMSGSQNVGTRKVLESARINDDLTTT